MKYRLVITAALLFAPLLFAQEQQPESTLLTELLERVKTMQHELQTVRDQNERLRHEFDTFRKQTGEAVESLHTTLEKRLQRLPRNTGDESGVSVEVVENVTEWQDEIIRLEDELARFRRQINSAVETLRRRVAAGARTAPGTPPVQAAAHDRERAAAATTATTMTTTMTAPTATTTGTAADTSPQETDKQADASGGARLSLLSGNQPTQDERDEYNAYREAMRALQHSDYARLRSTLAGFLERYPRGQYAANALYWIAESYYAEGSYDRAERFFKQVVEEHADDPKREDALLKLAYIRQHRDQDGASRAILEKLVESATREQIRSLAKQRLERLDREQSEQPQ